jgi:hypothetical protein
LRSENKKFSFAYTPVYPFLLSAYPILSLMAYNLGEIDSQAIARPLAVAMLLTLVLIGALYSLMRDWHKAAFVTGACSFLFFTYGHLRIIFRDAAWVQHTVLVPVWAGLFLLTLIMTYRTNKSLEAASLGLNALWLIFIVLPVFQMVTFEQRVVKNLEMLDHPSGMRVTSIPDPTSLPDIYYFILDSYTNADTLQTVYGYDNSEFLNGLEGLGFFIAGCSQSNFDRTELSLASSLNLDYLQTLRPELTPERREKLPLRTMIQHSLVRRTLEESGYQTITFATGFAWSELRDADQFIQPELPFSALSEFEVLLLRTTFMKALQDGGLVNYQVHEYRRFSERTHLILERLPELAAQTGPQFYFVHILEPHPPFVFNADGTDADAGSFFNAQGKYTAESYARGYIHEVEFINREMLGLVRALIENSSIPPVIIIQGDHGPWFQPPQYAMSILNAYYMGGRNDTLYATISPVNTFRIVFNEYLGADYSLLEDRSYNSPTSEPYNYALVPNTCP